MLSWDKTYLDAKEILNGKRILKKEFQLLKDFLKEEFEVELINADIYNEPIFKHLPTSLRIILDFKNTDGKLPVRYEERKRLIGDTFIKLLKEHQIDAGNRQKIKTGELDVRYIDIKYLQFEEALRNISSGIKAFDLDIIDVLRGGHTYFILYSNRETLNEKKILRQEQRILERIRYFVQEKGYKGKYSKMIQVILDEVASLEKAGGTYNYLRT